MGCGTSRSVSRTATSPTEVSAALASAGLESTQLVLGFDYSSPDRKETNRGKFLLTLRMFCRVLEGFQRDGAILAYGFGDLHTRDQMVFSFKARSEPCRDLAECWQRFVEIQEQVLPWGPSSIAPIVREATTLARNTQQHHTLVVVLDTELDEMCLHEVTHALAESAKYALSIVIVGIGRSTWHTLEALVMANVNFLKFDDQDGFWQEPANFKNAFVVEALKKVPAHYTWAKKEGLIRASPKGKTQPVHGTLNVCSPPDRPRETDPWYGLPRGMDAYWDEHRSEIVYVNKKTREMSLIPPSRPSSQCSTPRRHSQSSTPQRHWAQSVDRERSPAANAKKTKKISPSRKRIKEFHASYWSSKSGQSQTSGKTDGSGTPKELRRYKLAQPNLQFSL